MSDYAIQVDHVWKKFRKGEIHDSLRELIPAMAKGLMRRGTKKDELANREFWALKDVSFEVKRGESLGIIGPNGAGKSTMLKLLSRIIRPNSGRYEVNGRLSALIEVGAGFHGDLTGRENIYLSGTILGMKRKQIKAKEDQIIDFSGVEDFIDTPIKRYSSGMVARLGFAVAAHMEPEVLLVDEVLSVGDAKFRQKCIRHMHELIRSNVSVVFISHILDQVRALCPKTIVLDHGAVVYSGETEGAIHKYMEVLGDDGGPARKSNENAPAELRDIRITGTDRKSEKWRVQQPGVIECVVVVHRPIDHLSVLVGVSSIGGLFLGTANSGPMCLEPGEYPLRFTLDPMPLNNGDYTLEFSLHEGPMQDQTVWTMRQPRTISVYDGYAGAFVRFDGDWQTLDAQGQPSGRTQELYLHHESVE